MLQIMNIGELLDRTAISLRVSAADKRKALAVIAEIAARNFSLDAGDVLEALTERDADDYRRLSGIEVGGADKLVL